jgi:protein SCO1/2
MTPARLRLLVVLAALIAALAAGLVLALGHSASRSPARVGAGAQTAGTDTVAGFDGAALPGAQAPDFTLTDQSGRSLSLIALRGQVIVLAFISSTCGATCTLIAQQIRGALDELARPVPVLLISVDPAGDTPARVQRFLAQVALAGRARYLSASPHTLAAVWRAYRVQPLSSGRSAFERSATVTLLDRGGRERVIFGLEQLTPEGLTHDIRKLS